MTDNGAVLTTDVGTPARQALLERLQPLGDTAWQWLTDESASVDTQAPLVRISQRTIKPGTVGASYVHAIGFQVTITVPVDAGLTIAESRLDDAIEAFLWACDNSDVPWSQATKGLFGDEGSTGKRLGYSVDIDIFSNYVGQEGNE